MLAREPAPYVLFTGFGADSLDFQIRSIMRDVDTVTTLPSELRYSIYERFNAEGIEIPFAQRDVHIRNIGELGSALGARPDASGDE